ncbi:hypothetical protein K443DRAFT_677822 [Laccaria amethystina LaAM-08-1]|uniref:Uncharacterized protein n=1 Tax=Laccaria amethystina LaAM-08-1 TaxID=1095629 RepID=A0A0C9XWZ8_9AGAR|nr:hypothetical protein K443DRAFT_677822 [Laccaria amethystina LaAM-08-1]
MPSTVSVLEGAQNVRIEGGTINAVSGNMTINDSSRRTTNYDSFNTTNRTHNNSHNNYSVNDYSTRTTRNVHAGTVNNFGNAQNVNTGKNYGTINQQDSSGGPDLPPWVYEMLAQQQRGYEYQRGGGQGSRPPMPLAHSSPPAGLPYQHQPQNHGYPPYQLPSATYPPGFPPSHAYQSSAHYPAPREEGSYDDLYGDDEDEGLNPRGPVPLSAAGFMPSSHPGARSDLTASAPPTTASSNDSAQGVTPPAWKSNNPFGASAPGPRDYR